MESVDSIVIVTGRDILEQCVKTMSMNVKLELMNVLTMPLVWILMAVITAHVWHHIQVFRYTMICDHVIEFPP